jgi:hypothetical protein
VFRSIERRASRGCQVGRLLFLNIFEDDGKQGRGCDEYGNGFDALLFVKKKKETLACRSGCGAITTFTLLDVFLASTHGMESWQIQLNPE